MVADDIRFVTQVSAGRLLVAEIAGFEALAESGVLDIVVENTGCISAKFSVAVICSASIVRIAARENAVQPGQTWSFQVPIHTNRHLDAKNWCGVELIDAIGERIDSRNATFSTNATCTCLVRAQICSSVLNEA